MAGNYFTCPGFNAVIELTNILSEVLKLNVRLYIHVLEYHARPISELSALLS